MPESPTGKVIELHFHNQLGVQRLPLHGVLGAPATGPPGSFSSESRRLDYFLQLSRQRQTLIRLDRRAEADVIEQSLVVIEAQQQRTHQRLFSR